MRNIFRGNTGQSAREILRGLDPASLTRIKDGCWRIENPATGKAYYLKRTMAEEIEMTQKASALSLPEDTLLHMPRFVSDSLDDLPVFLHDRLPVEDPERASILVTEEHPVELFCQDTKTYVIGHLDTPYALMPEDFDAHGLPVCLRGQRVTKKEFDLLERDITAMNRSGVQNFDLGSNLIVERDRHGKLHFYAFDFEPHLFAAQNSYDDLETVKFFRESITAVGIGEGYERSKKFHAWQHVLALHWQPAETSEGRVVRVATNDMEDAEVARLVTMLKDLQLMPVKHESATLGPTIRVVDHLRIEQMQAHFSRLRGEADAPTAFFTMQH